MSFPSLAQRRAGHALKEIQKHTERNKSSARPDYGNYVSYVTALPATVLMNGLGQACATLLSKAEGKPEKPYRLLYQDLQSWLCGTDSAAPFKGASELMEAITNGNQDAYLRAQAEALAYLVWLKKFACAYLEPGAPE